MGTRDADHVVTEILHQAFEIHRDEGLVLDDQHVGGDLGGHFAAGGIGQLAGFGHIDAENPGHFLFGKTFQRQQQKGLPRQRRDVRQPPFRRHRQGGDVGIVVERNRIPDFREQPEQAGARAVLLVEQGRVLQQGFQHGPDIGVAGGLISRQCTGIAPQQRQMFSN